MEVLSSVYIYWIMRQDPIKYSAADVLIPSFNDKLLGLVTESVENE